MPRNGSGTYTLPAGNPVTTNTVISSIIQNTTMSDVASAMTASIAKDGQTVATANLPMGGFHHTNVGNATVRNNYSVVGQIQDNSFTYCGTATGTANAIILSSSPITTAYVAGQKFTFIASLSNTSSVDVNINALGALQIFYLPGVPLTGSEIQAGSVNEIVYNGTNFVLLSTSFGSNNTNGNIFGINAEIYNSSGTFTTKSTSIKVTAIGGSGYQDPGGTIAGGAGYIIGYITGLLIGSTISFTVGTNGSIGTPDGTASSFGTYFTVNGGGGSTSAGGTGAQGTVSSILPANKEIFGSNPKGLPLSTPIPDGFNPHIFIEW